LQLLVNHVDDTGRVAAGQAELLTSLVRRALHREVIRRTPQLYREGLLTENERLRINQGLWGKGPYDLPSRGLLIPKLETLAFRMQAGRPSAEKGQVRVAEESALERLAHSRAADILAAGLELNVLDKDLEEEAIAFYHQLVQEYFAGRVLAREPQPQRVEVAWRAGQVTPSLAEKVTTLEIGEPLPPLDATGWEETTLLAAAMTAGDGQDRFVDGLTLVNLPLAARCAAAPEVKINPALKQRIQEELLDRIADQEADLRARIAAAEALGDLGDPRFERREGPHGAYLLPPLLPISGGTYTIGDDNGEYSDEKPAHQVEVAAFEMSIFPVTNAEYRLFMETKPYDDERWWDTEAARAWRRGEGSNEGPKAQWRLNAETLRNNWTEEEIETYPSWTPEQKRTYLWLRRATAEELERQLEEWYPTGVKYQQPEYWEDSRFNHPSRPVVGVTWYEARAYCAWLSAQTGEQYDLPTEAEWEAAARGSLVDEMGDGGDRVGAGFKPAPTTYAYGDEYDAAKCNTFETHIRATTPVGVFPAGQTPQGIHDLTGNVWEWTSTIYRDYPYAADDGREDAEPADPPSTGPGQGLARRVRRGGSWRDDQNSARAVCRGGSHPDSRYRVVGLRVVRRPPSQNDH
jgi:formylglycine-generating enzyme required for sulfatase activity